MDPKSSCDLAPGQGPRGSASFRQLPPSAGRNAETDSTAAHNENGIKAAGEDSETSPARTRAPPGLVDSRISSQTKGKRPNILSPLRHCGSPEFFHHQRRSRRSLATRRGAHKPQRHSPSSLVVNDARNLDQEVSLTSLTALRSSLPVNDTRNFHQQGLASPRQSSRRVHGEVRCSRLSSSSRLPLRPSKLASSCQPRVSVPPLRPSPSPSLGLVVPHYPDRLPKA